MSLTVTRLLGEQSEKKIEYVRMFFDFNPETCIEIPVEILYLEIPRVEHGTRWSEGAHGGR